MATRRSQVEAFVAPGSVSFLLFPVAAKFLVYPIDRARMLIQTQWAPGIVQGEVPWQGVVLSWRRISDAEGCRSLWRGFGTTCLRWGPYQFINLATKDVLANRAPVHSRDHQWSLYFATKLLTGAAAGVFSAMIWGYPLDVIRQHLATHTASQAASASDVVCKVWQHQGLLGFYRGFVGDCTGLAIFRGVQLGGWDVVKEWYGKDEWNRKSTLSHFLHGQGISMLGSLLSYPIDTIRRNVVRSGIGISYRQCLSNGVIMGGGCMRYVYSGFSARIASSFVNGVILECWDSMKSQRGGR